MRMLSTRSRTRTPIGLDIGACGWRAAQVVRRGDRFVLRAAVARNRTGEDRGPDASSSASALQRALRSAPFRGRDVSCVLDPPSVEFFSLELPAAALSDANADLAEMTRWEVERMIGPSAEDTEARHWTLPPSPAPGPNAMAAAAKRTEVVRLVNLCRAAGWTCSCVDAGATALARFGSLLAPWTAEQVWGVLDIGFSESRIVLCVDETPVLVRRAGSGGGAWTQRVAETLRVSVKAAEVHKRDHGIALSGRGVRREVSATTATAPTEAPNSELSPILLGALRSELREIASEIKRSYEYVLSRYPARHAADLVLVGGGATLKNLPEFLGGALGIDVRRASDYPGQNGSRLSPGGCHPYGLESLAQAIGAAIGS